ncbi:Chloroperoxidase [Podospora didyma]|uniref:Chloroperoxidase n=1 Tax=Podospora didyma TaxID=330526 RepID=A0AAE0TVG8_9PEZI|nr:Chloroperoxidase [Podospora didyma]
MHLRLSFAGILLAGSVWGYGTDSDSSPWTAPLSTDRRSPCPMLNVLANQGFLPHTGLNISLDQLYTAFNQSVNLEPTSAEIPSPSCSVIEHDGSLSRADTYFGDNHSFNATIWNQTRSFFTEETISLATAAKARSARLWAAAAAVNPTFNLPLNDMKSSILETALYLIIFGNDTQGDAKTQWVRILFELRSSYPPITTGMLVQVGAEIAALR